MANLTKGGKERPKSLCIVGESRLGKTEWAKSLGQHLEFNGYFDMGQFTGDRSNLRYAIFDDFPFDKIPRPKQWFGAQQRIVITDKYKPKLTLEWGKPTIYLCNEDQDTGIIEHVPWYKANVVFIKITEPLY